MQSRLDSPSDSVVLASRPGRPPFALERGLKPATTRFAITFHKHVVAGFSPRLLLPLDKRALIGILEEAY